MYKAWLVSTVLKPVTFVLRRFIFLVVGGASSRRKMQQVVLELVDQMLLTG
jgi:hypothetical protein